jgi:hypothetical protein
MGSQSIGLAHQQRCFNVSYARSQVRGSHKHIFVSQTIYFTLLHSLKTRLFINPVLNNPNPDTVNRIQNPLQTIFKSASILSDNSEDKTVCGNVFSVPGPKAKEEVLSGASDWKVQFDIDVTDGASLGYRTSLPFPPEIAVVSGKGSRPDGVIWSLSLKTVIWIELTSPWEENMSKRHYEKKSKYNKLALELRNPQRAGGAWTVHPLEVEIGARGAINPQS